MGDLSRFSHLLSTLLMALGLAFTPQLSAGEESLLNPCNNQEPGFGHYHPWPVGKDAIRLLMPKRSPLTADQGFDLIIHFHGSNAIRKLIVDEVDNIVIVGINLGAGALTYGRPFEHPDSFPTLLRNIENAVAAYSGNNKAHIRHLALTGWSAGYGAIRAILRHPDRDRVDAVALLDGLHSDYEEENSHQLNADQMAPFVRFAQRAAKSRKFLFLSHSSIIPPGYSSTTETTHYLTRKLGIPVKGSKGKDSPLLQRYEQAKRGQFLMQGYLGKEKIDHCAQLALISPVVKSLQQRWQSSKISRQRQPLAQRIELTTIDPARTFSFYQEAPKVEGSKQGSAQPGSPTKTLARAHVH